MMIIEDYHIPHHDGNDSDDLDFHHHYHYDHLNNNIRWIKNSISAICS
jgi:hypothetical protein